jgi:type II secretion system protein H
MRRYGFTLIELSAVLAIMGLLAAACVLSLIPTAREHRFDATCKELAFADSQLRSAARQSGTAQHLVIDLNHNAFLWRQSADSTTVLARLPEAWELKVRTPDVAIADNGQVDIAYSPEGYSQTYAIRLPHGDEDHWMIVAGLSGRIFWTNDEKQLQSIFESLAPPSLAAPASADAH